VIFKLTRPDATFHHYGHQLRFIVCEEVEKAGRLGQEGSGDGSSNCGMGAKPEHRLANKVFRAGVPYFDNLTNLANPDLNVLRLKKAG
jgi:hypothetical protein